MFVCAIRSLGAEFTQFLGRGLNRNILITFGNGWKVRKNILGKVAAHWLNHWESRQILGKDKLLSFSSLCETCMLVWEVELCRSTRVCRLLKRGPKTGTGLCYVETWLLTTKFDQLCSVICSYNSCIFHGNNSWIIVV